MADSPEVGLERQVKLLKEEVEELQLTLDLIQSRASEATAIWQKETGNHHVFPDMGCLLGWAMDRAQVKNQSRKFTAEDWWLRCGACDIRLFTSDMAIESDGKFYHKGCLPDSTATNNSK